MVIYADSKREHLLAAVLSIVTAIAVVILILVK